MHGKTIGRVVAWVCVALLGLAGIMSVWATSSPADAAMLQDQDPGVGARLGARIGELDVTIRTAQGDLPAVEATVTATAAAYDAAQKAEALVRTVGAPLARTTSGSVLDTAANAILGDLAPEQASATVDRAREGAATAVAARDALRAQLAAATAERAEILGDLDAAGQHLTRWSVLLLDGLSAPVTSENLRAMAAWVGAEANDVTLRNPLATTMDAPGAKSANDHGVKGYPTEEIGLDATVRTLRLSVYKDVVAGLLQGDSALKVMTAVADSPWGTGENGVLRLAADRR